MVGGTAEAVAETTAALDSKDEMQSAESLVVVMMEKPLTFDQESLL